MRELIVDVLLSVSLFKVLNAGLLAQGSIVGSEMGLDHRGCYYINKVIVVLWKRWQLQQVQHTTIIGHDRLGRE